MDNKKTDIKTLLSSDKARLALIIAALLAVVLIFFSSSNDDAQSFGEFDAQSYQDVLSQNILDMVISVEGAGEAKVLLTLENSYEYIYLDDGKTLQKINEPTIRGIVVVCDGGNSPTVCAQITELLTTVLNIPSTKVCISKLI